MGAVLYRAGRHEEAIQCLTELVRSLEDADAEANHAFLCTWYSLAMAHRKTGNDEQARQYFSKANGLADMVLADEENLPAWHQRVELGLFRKETESLLAAPSVGAEGSDQKGPRPSYDVQLSVSGAHQWALQYRRGRRSAAAGNWTDAVTAFTQASELRPDNWQVWKFLGEAHEKLDQWDEALDDYGKAIALEPEEWPLWMARAEEFAQSEQWDKAMALYACLLTHHSENWELWNARGKVHEKLDQWDKALADYGKAIALEPEEWPLWMARAELFAQAKQWPAVIALCTKLVEYQPENGAIWKTRAFAHFSLGQWDEASSAYGQVIRLVPTDLDARTWRGNAYNKSGAYEKALTDVNEVIRLDSAASYAYGVRAEVYLAMKQYDQAMADANAHIRLVPASSWGYNLRGRARVKLNDYEGAIADLSEAIRHAPRGTWEAPYSYKTRAEVYARLGEYEKAVADARQVIKLTPKDSSGWLALLDLELAHGASVETVQALVAEAETALDGPAALEIVFQQAAWDLLSNRQDDYEKTCRESAAQYADSTETTALYLVARTAALTKRPVVDTEQLVKMASRVVEADQTGGISTLWPFACCATDRQTRRSNGSISPSNKLGRCAG